MLENAGTRMGIAEGTEGSHLAFIGNKDHFAGLYAAYIFRADHVECHGFRSENSGVAKLAHHQWTDAQGIAAGDHAFRRHADEGIGAFDLLQRIDELVEQGAVGGRSEEGRVGKEGVVPGRSRWSPDT